MAGVLCCFELGGNRADDLDGGSGNYSGFYFTRELFAHDCSSDGRNFLAAVDLVLVGIESFSVDFGDYGFLGAEGFGTR